MDILLKFYLKLFDFFHETLGLKVYQVSFIIGLATGLVAALFIQDFVIYVILILIGIALNELFRHYFKLEAEQVIIVQTEDESDQEYLDRIEDTITSSIRGELDTEQFEERD